MEDILNQQKKEGEVAKTIENQTAVLPVKRRCCSVFYG